MSASVTRRFRTLLALLLAFALLAAACSEDDPNVAADPDPGAPAETDPDAETPTETEDPVEPVVVTEDRSFYILPPGNFGGFPNTNDNSFDQLPLYDGLTQLRDNVTDADIESHFLPMDFAPIGEVTVEETGRPGTTIEYDEWGIAHVTGETRDDVAFGAGWVTARDRSVLIGFGRGPARAAVADIPGIDAFSLVTSGTPFVPSEATEQLVTDQIQVILDEYGDEGEEIISDAQAYADGLTAYWEANDIPNEPATVNDVIATTAFIGSIFGAGGGSEASNAEFLSTLQAELGEEQGRLVWEDLLQTDDPEAPTTLEERFEYGTYTGGEVVGSAVIDAGSVISFDPLEPAEDSAPSLNQNISYEAAGDPPFRNASNWLTVSPGESVNDTTLAVMGPQLGYYYPEIVQQIHLSGPGIEAQGAAVPGLAMYILIGRTPDYAWSLTSANQDVRDVFAEELCEADGSTPSRTSSSYMHNGECIPFESFDAGTLGGQEIVYPVSVHGPVIGTATSNGTPIALTRQRSTFGRDGLNLGALKNMTEGDADTPEKFYDVANQFGFTFNWGYANRDTNAYFASGYLPVRAEGLDRRLPTWGTGEYEWQGFLERDAHPHADSHPSGRLVNWNNQSAPGFMHGDGTNYGAAHRVEVFDQWPEEAQLSDVVSIMNRAASEEVASPTWPTISAVLAQGEAPSDLAAEVVGLVDAWVADDAPQVDADDDGFYDEAGPMLWEAVFDPIARAVLDPVLGPLVADGVRIRGIGSTSLMDKDLRTLLGEDVEGAFNVRYCGAGDIDACAASMWAAIDDAVQAAAADQGDDPSTWQRETRRSSFTPGLVDITFRSTNRPTYQQVIEFAPAS